MRHLAAAALLLTAACNDTGLSGIIEPEPDGAVIEVTPTRLDFGETTSDAPVTQEFMITNVGVWGLNIEDIFLMGSADSYALPDDFPDYLDPGASAVLNVTFAPRRSDQVVAFVEIASDSIVDAPEVDLIGFGQVPELQIDPPEFDFGNTFIGCQDDTTLQLSNVGNEDLVIDAIDYAGDSSLGLVDLPNLPLTLEPGAATTVTVDFQPVEEVAYEALLTVSSNDPAGPKEAFQIGDGAYESYNAETFEMPVAPPVDILFAIDQSCSMEDDATRLGANFERFVDQIDAVTTGWNVGVATRDDGCFRDGALTSRVANYQRLFASAVLAWDGGAYTESLLTVARNALRSAQSGCNAGFLRPDANLHVILVSDEPEQSRDSWSTLVSQIRDLHPTSSDRVKISAVAGDYPRGCGSALPGEGYFQAVEDTGGEYLSICDSNWARHVEALAKASIEGLGEFELAKTPDPGTVLVFVNSVEWTSGWHLEGSTLVFDETPPEGAGIRVEYGALACP